MEFSGEHTHSQWGKLSNGVKLNFYCYVDAHHIKECTYVKIFSGYANRFVSILVRQFEFGCSFCLFFPPDTHGYQVIRERRSLRMLPMCVYEKFIK